MSRFTNILILLASVVFSLACGTLPAVAQMPLEATQTATEFIATTRQFVSPTETPVFLIVLGDGTWNIRTGAGLSYPVVEIANGGETFEKLSMLRGWVETPQGWICGRAFGGSQECQ